MLAERALIQRARVVIVAAGMEGALPSVVGGLVSVPVVAIPTSIGYGASFGGRGTARNAELLCVECYCGKYRQRLRRGLRRESDQSQVEEPEQVEAGSSKSGA